MANTPLLLKAESGSAYWGAGDSYTFLITGDQSGGAYFTMHAVVPPGGGPPPHIHHREEEQFYILDGELTFRLGSKFVRVAAGDYVHVPRETIHCFRNDSGAPARTLISYSPAGIEKLFMEVFVPVTDSKMAPPVWTDEDTRRFIAAESSYGLESLAPDDPRLLS